MQPRTDNPRVDNARPDNRETEYEMEKPGNPTRPATEPEGAEGSSQTDKTLSDPATGEPNHSPSD